MFLKLHTVTRPYLPRNSLLYGLSPSIQLHLKPFPLLAIARDFVPLLREEVATTKQVETTRQI